MKRNLVPVALLFLAARPVEAYLDPGTGSILVQGLLAGLAAASAMVAAFWSRIRQFLSGRRASGASAEREDHDSPDS